MKASWEWKVFSWEVSTSSDMRTPNDVATVHGETDWGAGEGCVGLHLPNTQSNQGTPNHQCWEAPRPIPHSVPSQRICCLFTQEKKDIVGGLIKESSILWCRCPGQQVSWTPCLPGAVMKRRHRVGRRTPKPIPGKRTCLRKVKTPCSSS